MLSPVPPDVVGRAAPERVNAKVPEVVIGDPEIDRKEGTVAATEVTPGGRGVSQKRVVPFEARY